ncbi:MAG TPA: PH domain-containing protein [Candidatus Binataceae bacterium]|nr:PH domain-containing protein [Candidatus Binataceae bacterium]
MRCPQCGSELAAGAAFCSRCGTRLYVPKPADVREYALAKLRPSAWQFAHAFVLGAIIIGGGSFIVYNNHDAWRPGFALVAFGILVITFAVIAVRAVSWSITSDRVIERRGYLASRRREMELADIRSVEVDRRILQRLLGLGNVTIASAASADFAIQLRDIYDPEAAAETIRKARLKRLA